MSVSYKDSPVGEIPSDWEIVTLGEIGDTYNGLTGKTKIDFGRGKPYITYMNIYSNPKLKNNFVDFVEIGEEENQNSVQYGDIFFTTSSETADEVGFSSVLLDKIEECYLNSFCFGFRMKNFATLLPEYAVYVLRGEKSRKKISVLAQGSTRFNLSKITLLKRLHLSLPPLPEQQKIADILSTVDAKIEVIDQQITETQDLKNGLMQRLLTKGIGHTEFKDSALGEIPVGWKVVRINEVTSYVDYRGKTPPKVNSGILLVTARNIKMGKIDYEVSKEFIPSDLYDSVMSRGVPKIGDVLITTEAPLGNIASVDKEDIALAQRVIKYRGNKDVLDNGYLKQYMIGSVFQRLLEKQSTGSTVKGIKGSVLHKLNIALPSFVEQQQIAKILSSVDEKLDVLSEKKETYQELKKGLMQQLLTGKVRVKV